MSEVTHIVKRNTHQKPLGYEWRTCATMDWLAFLGAVPFLWHLPAADLASRFSWRSTSTCWEQSQPPPPFGQEGSPRTPQPRRHALESNNQKFRKCGIPILKFLKETSTNDMSVFVEHYRIEYSTETESILYLLMPWTLSSPCHQQSQYDFWFNIVSVILKVNLNIQYHFSVEVQ